MKKFYCFRRLLILFQGLYPESHGIIDNNMYDMNIGKRFYLGSNTSSDPRWWGGEPVSITLKYTPITDPILLDYIIILVPFL